MSDLVEVAGPLPDPTPAQLASPQFAAVWEVIKGWDIDIGGCGREGATGSHVAAILGGLSATPLWRLSTILDAVATGGSVVIRCEHGQNPDWSLMSVFGSEAEDSPMAGGSHVGSGDTLDECLASAVR